MERLTLVNQRESLSYLNMMVLISKCNINMFKRVFTWKGCINRCEFIITFVLAIVLIHVFVSLAFDMFYLHYPFNNMRFNLSLSFFYPLTVLGFVLGVIPLLLSNLFYINKSVIQWRGVYDTDFLPLMIVVDILFVLYIFQCFKRCHDLGKSGLYCLIPFWNPILRNRISFHEAQHP